MLYANTQILITYKVIAKTWLDWTRCEFHVCHAGRQIVRMGDANNLKFTYCTLLHYSGDTLSRKPIRVVSPYSTPLKSDILPFYQKWRIKLFAVCWHPKLFDMSQHCKEGEGLAECEQGSWTLRLAPVNTTTLCWFPIGIPVQDRL